MTEEKKPNNLEMEKIKLERFKIYGVVITVSITVLFVCILIAYVNYMSPNRKLVQKLQFNQTGLKLQEEKVKVGQSQVYLEIERMKLERFKVWGKIIVAAITVLFGSVLVACINRSYQNRQLKQQKLLNEKELELQQKKATSEIDLQGAKAEADQRQAEMKYLGEFVKFALEDNYDKRLRFADYFAALTLSEGLQKNWQRYRDGIVEKQKEIKEVQLELSEAEKEKNAEKVANLTNKLNQMQVQADALPEKSDSYLTHEMADKFLDVAKPNDYTENKFEVKTINDDKVIVDRATGLTWQQSGSDKKIGYDDAMFYIANLNRDKFAGYNDWRLPTLKEAITLLSQEENSDGLFIGSEFDKMQTCIWTSDLNSTSHAWVVSFDYGECYVNYINKGYVRAVRLVQ